MIARLRGLPPAAVLALPFLVGIAALRGLTVALPIFHSDDELNYHLPTIHRFARELPFPDLVHYRAAQTPLFHLLMALVGEAVGFSPWRLRLAEVVISYLLALTVFALLRRRLALAAGPALALALLFALSPYVLGSSFRVITDNLATLLIVVALERFERFRETPRLGVLGAGCAAVGAAMLTRQSAAFMLPVALLYALRFAATARDRALGLASVGLCAVPVAALFLAWHGVVPPGGDPSSCGLCAGAAGGARLVLATPELALAALGLYGVVLFAPGIVPFDPGRRVERSGARTGSAGVGTEGSGVGTEGSGVATEGSGARAGAAPVGVGTEGSGARAGGAPVGAGTEGSGARAGGAPVALLGALVGALLLLAFPDRPGADAAGVIAGVARHGPRLLGSSLVLWALVPAGGAVLAWRARVAPRPWSVVVFAGCFLLGALAIRYPWQKYVDPFALLTLLLSVRGGELASPRALAGALVLVLAFVAYTADPAAHRDVPTRTAGHELRGYRPMSASVREARPRAASTTPWRNPRRPHPS